MILNKRAQQEMLGFAFIIFLVILIGIAFLIFSLRQGPSVMERENIRVNNLLNGISYYTTECEKKSIQQLIVSCERGDLVDCEGVDACNFVEGEIKEILRNSLRGDYLFTIDFENPSVGDIEISKGECPGRRVALSAISVLPRGISIKLLSCPGFE